jgi:hypothetical protein
MNQEEIKRKRSEWYKQYRLTRDKSEIVICECGASGLKDNIARHRKSKKHQLYVKACTQLDNKNEGIYKNNNESKTEVVSQSTEDGL